MIARASRRQTQWVHILTFPTPNRAFGYKKRRYRQAETLLRSMAAEGYRPERPIPADETGRIIDGLLGCAGPLNTSAAWRAGKAEDIQGEDSPCGLSSPCIFTSIFSF